MAEKKQLKPLAELRTLDATALEQKISELRAQLVEQQRAHAAQELPSTAAITKLRKQIAQAHTLLGEHKRTQKEEK